MLSSNILVDFKRAIFAEFKTSFNYSNNKLQKETGPISHPIVESHFLLLQLHTGNLEVEKNIQVQQWREGGVRRCSCRPGYAASLIMPLYFSFIYCS